MDSNTSERSQEETYETGLYETDSEMSNSDAIMPSLITSSMGERRAVIPCDSSDGSIPDLAGVGSERASIRESVDDRVVSKRGGLSSR